MDLSTLLWNAKPKPVEGQDAGAVSGGALQPDPTTVTNVANTSGISGISTPQAEVTDVSAAEGDDPIVEATKQYLRQVKAPVYESLSRKATEISQKQTTLPETKYIHEGDVDLYAPDVLARREALTQSPRIISAIDDIWAIVQSTLPRVTTKMFKQFLESKAADTIKKQQQRAKLAGMETDAVIQPKDGHITLPYAFQAIIDGEAAIWTEGVVTRRTYELIHRQFLLALAPLGTPQLQAQVRAVIDADWRADVGISEPEAPVLPAGVLLDPNTGTLPSTWQTLSGTGHGSGQTQSGAEGDSVSPRRPAASTITDEVHLSDSMRHEVDRDGGDNVASGIEGYIGGDDDNGGALWAEYVDWLQDTIKSGAEDEKPKKKPKEAAKPKAPVRGSPRAGDKSPRAAPELTESEKAPPPTSDSLTRPGKKPVSKAAAKLMMMNKRMFFASMFSITDIWTATVSESEYSRFLRFLESSLKPAVNWKPAADSPDEDLMSISSLAEECDVVCRVRQYNERKKQEEMEAAAAAAVAAEAARLDAVARAQVAEANTFKIEEAVSRPRTSQGSARTPSAGRRTSTQLKSPAPRRDSGKPTATSKGKHDGEIARAIKSKPATLKPVVVAEGEPEMEPEPQLVFEFEFAPDDSSDDDSDASSPGSSLRIPRRLDSSDASQQIESSTVDTAEPGVIDGSGEPGHVPVLLKINKPKRSRRHSVATSQPTERKSDVKGAKGGTGGHSVINKSPKRQIVPPVASDPTAENPDHVVVADADNTSSPILGGTADIETAINVPLPAANSNDPAATGPRSALSYVLESELAAAQAAFEANVSPRSRSPRPPTGKARLGTSSSDIRATQTSRMSRDQTSSPRPQILHHNFGQDISKLLTKSPEHSTVQPTTFSFESAQSPRIPHMEGDQSKVLVDESGWPVIASARKVVSQDKESAAQPPGAASHSGRVYPGLLPTPPKSASRTAPAETAGRQTTSGNRQGSARHHTTANTMEAEAVQHDPEDVKEILHFLNQRRFSAPEIRQLNKFQTILKRSTTVSELKVPPALAHANRSGISAPQALMYNALQASLSRRTRTALLAQQLAASDWLGKLRRASYSVDAARDPSLAAAYRLIHDRRSTVRPQSAVRAVDLHLGIPRALEGMDPLLGRGVHDFERQDILEALEKPRQWQAEQYLHEKHNIPVSTALPYPGRTQSKIEQTRAAASTPSAFHRKIMVARPNSRVNPRAHEVPKFLQPSQPDRLSRPTPRPNAAQMTDMLRTATQIASLYSEPLSSSVVSPRQKATEELLAEVAHYADLQTVRQGDITPSSPVMQQTIAAGFRAIVPSPRPAGSMPFRLGSLPLHVSLSNHDGARLGKHGKGWQSLGVVPPWLSAEALPFEQARWTSSSPRSPRMEKQEDLVVDGKATTVTYFRVDPNTGRIVIVGTQHVSHLPTPQESSRNQDAVRVPSRAKPFGASSRMWFLPSSLAVTGMGNYHAQDTARDGMVPHRPSSQFRPARARLLGPHMPPAPRADDDRGQLAINSARMADGQTGASGPLQIRKEGSRSPRRDDGPITAEKLATRKLPPALQAQVLDRLVAVSSLPKPQYLKFLRQEVEFARGHRQREQAMHAMEARVAHGMQIRSDMLHGRSQPSEMNLVASSAPLSVPSFGHSLSTIGEVRFSSTVEQSSVVLVGNQKQGELRSPAAPAKPSDRVIRDQIRPSPRTGRVTKPLQTQVEKALTSIVPTIFQPKMMQAVLRESRVMLEQVDGRSVSPTAALQPGRASEPTKLNPPPSSPKHTFAASKTASFPIFPSSAFVGPRSSGGTHSGQLALGQPGLGTQHAIIGDGPLTGFLDGPSSHTASQTSISPSLKDHIVEYADVSAATRPAIVTAATYSARGREEASDYRVLLHPVDDVID